MAYQSAGVTAGPFSYTQSLVFLAFAYLGGISCVSGAVAGGLLVEGGLLFTFLQDKLGVPPEMTLVLGGLGLVVAAILNPEGIAGRIARDGRRLSAWVRERPRPTAPEAPAAVSVPGSGAA